jgi:hypothetical protein
VLGGEKMVGNNQCSKGGVKDQLSFMIKELKKYGIEVPKDEKEITHAYCTRCCKSSYVC